MKVHISFQTSLNDMRPCFLKQASADEPKHEKVCSETVSPKNGNISGHNNMEGGKFHGTLPLQKSYRQLITVGRRISSSQG